MTLTTGASVGITAYSTNISTAQSAYPAVPPFHRTAGDKRVIGGDYIDTKQRRYS